MIYIYPTDTVWGIGSNIHDEVSTQKIKLIKGNNPNKPLSIIFPHIKGVVDFFSLPDTIPNDWMEEFFSLQTTLMLPRKFSRQDIPPWVTGDSDYVAVRCVPLDFLKSLYSTYEAPITSTSLNLAGEPPIYNLTDAKEFVRYIDCEYKIIEKDSCVPVGTSSSIISIENDGSFKLRRQGESYSLVAECIARLGAEIIS